MSAGRAATRVMACALALALATPVAARRDTGKVSAVRLPNGFTLLVRENAVAPVVAMSLLVRMGTRWETPDRAGLSNFVHAVMVKGTRRHSGAALAEALAAVGGKLSAAGDVDYSEIRGTALARFWRQLLGLMAEVALEPTLAPDEVDRERESLLTRVQRRLDSAPAHAFDEAYAALYGAHPYALPTLGTRASLARIDTATIAATYRRFYRPERMVLAVSGQLDADAVLTEARRLFGDMPAGDSSVLDRLLAPPIATSKRLVIEQAAQQTQIVVAGLAPPLDHRDHAAVKVLATVLGGGMAGRLFSELRDRRALAYTAAAYYEPVKNPGAFVLYLGTMPENAARAEAALREEIRRVQTEAVGVGELARAKGYVLGRYAMDRRTNERMAWYLAFYDVEGVTRDYPERYRAAVDAVTAADVQRVARDYLATVTTVVLGPRPTR